MVSQKRAIDWDKLNRNGFDGFTVTRLPPPKPNKKRKTNDDAADRKSSPFPRSELKGYDHRITPAAPWNSMKKFGNFKSK
jgi:hypothetical protein